MRRQKITPVTLLAVVMLILPSSALAARGGQLKLIVVEKGTGKPLAARIHLKNSAGRMPKVTGVPTLADHFSFDGEITLKLNNGGYRFEIECGPEYLDQQGHFEIADFADDEKTVEMQRFVDMAKEGWYSGDLEVARSAKDIELLMRADDLHVAHLITPKAKPISGKVIPIPPGITNFDGNHCYRSADGEPILRNVRQPASWDFPVLVSEGAVDCVQLASPQLRRADMSADEAGCKPRDKTFFPGPEGIAQWNEKIYYHLLNCGLRIPPAAGSGSGDTPNPVGYNRVYVHLDGDFSYDAWLAGLKAGRVLVTNGPMVRADVEGQFPGHVFQADEGQQIELEIGLNLATREHISYLEIIQNGRALHTVRLDEFKKAGGRLPKVKFTESGWFLLRAVTDNAKTHRFAMTGPYYIEIAYKPKISKESAQFFLDWTTQRLEQLKQGKEKPTAETISRHEKAQEFWRAKVSDANSK